MGILAKYTAREETAPGDAIALRDVLSAVGSVDGSVDAQERAVIDAMFRTVPQLRDQPIAAPPRSGRDAILADLGKLQSPRLKRQCFVLAVELAMASEGINEAEDRFLEALWAALGLDPNFAAMVVQVFACKYARANEP